MLCVQHSMTGFDRHLACGSGVVPMAQTRPTILVVDDTATNLSLLADLLKDQYRVKVAPSGEAALRIAQSDNKPDLILLDIMMPGMNGYDVCRRLKAEPSTQNIPVIFQTALSGEEDELLGFQLGAVDFISKPINPHRLLARIATHLELFQAREALAHQNEELQNAARLREDVDMILRHDLKTPLNAIVGVPQCIIDMGNVSESEADLLRMIEESGLKMLEMINLSLDLLKMERGSYRFEPVGVDLMKTCRSVMNDLGHQARMAQVGMALTVGGQPASDANTIQAAGEALLCYSLLANLCKNAIEAAPPNSNVAIDLSTTEDAVQLRIRNPGEVPETIRSSFFDKYVTANKAGGTGLGTYSARLITETQHGQISLDTSEPGHTTIIVTLPLFPET